MSNVNLKALQQEAATLTELINRTNSALNAPASQLAQSYTRVLSQKSGYIGAKLAQAVSGKRLDQALVIGAVLGAAYVGAKGIDLVQDALSDAKARKQLLGYYQELTVKHSLLIDEQQKLIDRLVQLNDSQQEEKLALQNRLNEITDIVKQIMALNQKVQK